MLKARWQVARYDDDDDDDDEIKQTYILQLTIVITLGVFNTTIVWKNHIYFYIYPINFKHQRYLLNRSWRVQLKNVARVKFKKCLINVNIKTTFIATISGW